MVPCCGVAPNPNVKPGSSDVFATAIPVSYPPAETTYGKSMLQAHLLMRNRSCGAAPGSRLKRGIGKLLDGACAALEFTYSGANDPSAWAVTPGAGRFCARLAV